MFEYDDDGRLLGSRVEVEWDDDERGWMLALAEYEADLCGGCGGLLSDTTRPDSEGAYLIEPAVRCHKCTALSAARQALQDSSQPEALYPIVRKRGE